MVDHGILEGDVAAPYLVMEQLEGKPLSAIVEQGVQPLSFATAVVEQLSRALRVAHAAGVVHRDIKPGNVFLCPAEDDSAFFLKLLDFGVAKLLGTADEHEGESTRQGELVGTPNYMSPEQVLGSVTLDARSDIFSVAALVYRIVLGEPPFGRGSAMQVATRIAGAERPKPPTTVDGALPKAFDDWMARGLAKDREARFQTIDEMARALRLVEAGRPVELDVTLDAVAPSPPRRRRWPFVVGAGLLSAAAIVGLVASSSKPPVQSSGESSTKAAAKTSESPTIVAPSTSSALPAAASPSPVSSPTASSTSPKASPPPPKAKAAPKPKPSGWGDLGAW